MFVHVLADNAAKLSELCSLLDRRFQIAGERLDVDSKLSELPDALVVRADLRVIENIAALKRRSARTAKVSKRIFLIEQPSHACISQAYALGATLAVTGKINPAKLFAALANRGNSEAASPTGATQEDNAVEVAAAAIGSMFAAASFGEPIDVMATIEAGRGIAERITERGLAEWLTAVRRHHEGTYQHCLLVTGVAIDFGLSLGLKRTDLERLYSAAMFHDIGKAKIPLAILDKPGRLDAEERALVETHPVAGYEFLKAQTGISAEILDAVRHHHEYLDGSGYPDALSAESIADIVRMLTIADIFAALIEHRHYKPTMPRSEAYGILSGMQGKLEKALVIAFKQVALTR
ncbi:HD-GYP domain-containing protein [Bradyrhizobium sp. DASA03120]|uniref:HD-GYP domain-containing protein n=1 Tax=Bradyrhizobium sp. SMVTL-02 TaxID=3395917 RepID=UPI003F6F8128